MGLPRLRISIVSPRSSHLESRANSFRKSRMVAVFMVIHLYHEKKLSKKMMLKLIINEIKVATLLKIETSKMIHKIFPNRARTKFQIVKDSNLHLDAFGFRHFCKLLKGHRY